MHTSSVAHTYERRIFMTRIIKLLYSEWHILSSTVDVCEESHREREGGRERDIEIHIHPLETLRLHIAISCCCGIWIDLDLHSLTCCCSLSLFSFSPPVLSPDQYAQSQLHLDVRQWTDPAPRWITHPAARLVARPLPEVCLSLSLCLCVSVCVLKKRREKTALRPTWRQLIAALTERAQRLNK